MWPLISFVKEMNKKMSPISKRNSFSLKFFVCHLYGSQYIFSKKKYIQYTTIVTASVKIKLLFSFMNIFFYLRKITRYL